MTRLDEEKLKLVNINNWVKEEKKSLEGMVDAKNGKDLYTEILTVLNVQLHNVEKKIRELQYSNEDPDDALSNHLWRAREMLKNEFWQDQSRLSMLVAAGAQTEHHMGDVRPNTSPFDQSREYYTFVGAGNTNTLFGTPFETVLGML